jgi:hypothetical protein
MKRRPAPQKLAIRRDTIRQLAAVELSRALGGGPVPAFDTGASCVTAPVANPPISAARGG